MTPTRRIIAEKRSYVYPLAGALLLNAILLVVVVMPLSKKVQGGEAAAQQATTELNNARREYNNARGTVTGKDSADGELKKFYGAVLPADHSQARRILFKLPEMATSANLSMASGSSAPSQGRDSPLGKITSDNRLTGQYRDIRKFIYDIETSPDFLILENVILSQGQNEGGPLVMNLRVATYYRAGGE
jgi:Tfp pilus assembly protein PilO